MKNRLTDNEIIKALESCPSDSVTHDCSMCPYKENVFCFELLGKDVLKIINRQKAEIERLAEFLDDKCDRCIEKERTEAVNEFANELLRVFAGHSDYHGDTILTKIACLREGKAIKCAEPIDTNKIKAEAIKQFAERLKENKIDIDVSFGYGREVYTESVAVIEIDNLVKEMVGE